MPHPKYSNYDDRSVDYDDWSIYDDAMTFDQAPALRLLPGRNVEVRPARPGDLPRLEAFLARCSDETLYRRFHGAVGSAVDKELWRIAHPAPSHRSWVVVADGDVRGTATLAWGRDGDPEAAFLVEDAWFRHGLGRALFGAVAEEAGRSGADQVDAWVLADNHAVRQFLGSMAPHAHTKFAGGGELVVHIPVTVGVQSGTARAFGATA
jgi:GNAT superfamily N-acetyltransferase